MDRGAWQATVHGVVGHDWAANTFPFPSWDSTQLSAHDQKLFHPISYRGVVSLDLWQMVLHWITTEMFIIWLVCGSCVSVWVQLWIYRLLLLLTHFGQEGTPTRNRGFLLFKPPTSHLQHHGGSSLRSWEVLLPSPQHLNNKGGPNCPATTAWF